MLSCYLWQGKVAPPLTNFVIYPVSFTAYTFCNVTPSWLAWKGEEHRIQKTQNSTTDLLFQSTKKYNQEIKMSASFLHLAYCFHMFLKFIIIVC